MDYSDDYYGKIRTVKCAPILVPRICFEFSSTVGYLYIYLMRSIKVAVLNRISLNLVLKFLPAIAYSSLLANNGI